MSEERGFLYFVEGGSSAFNEQKLEAAGLTYALEGVSFRRQETGNGPEGQHGALVMPERLPPKLGLDPETQTWRRIPDTTSWVGMVTDAPPEPRHLKRPTTVDGYWCKLADGHPWSCPVAIHLAGFPSLPCSLTCDDAGNWVDGEVDPRYRHLWDRARALYDAVYPELESGVTEWDVTDFADAAVDALAANYHVGPAECSLLGVLDDDAIGSVLSILIELPLLQQATDALKKKEALPEDFSPPPAIAGTEEDSTPASATST